MFVCLCSGAKEKDIKECIESGCKTIKQFASEHNICADCKKCRNQIKKIIENNKNGI
jgi:bacterioferritin-associated ferredoxin